MRFVTMLMLALVVGGACSSDGGNQTGGAGSSGNAGATGGSGGSSAAGGMAGTSSNAGNGGTTGSGGSGGGSPDGTFACGPTVRCNSYREYCFFEEWNGAVKIDYQCRPLSDTCGSCGCARSDAASASMLCKTPSTLTCTNGQMTIDDQTNSPTLNLFCLIA